MIRLLSFILFCLALITTVDAQTGSYKTPSQLNTEINTLLPDNNTGLITPFVTRQMFKDVVASAGTAPACSVVGDGIADDTAALIACEAARPVGSAMVWPPGTYKITAPIGTTKSGSWDMQGVTINSTCGNLLINNSNFTLNGGRSTLNFSACAGPNQNRAIRVNPNGTFTTNGTINPGVTG